jgi:hypothetical protein
VDREVVVVPLHEPLGRRDLVQRRQRVHVALLNVEQALDQRAPVHRRVEQVKRRVDGDAVQAHDLDGGDTRGLCLEAQDDGEDDLGQERCGHEVAGDAEAVAEP